MAVKFSAQLLKLLKDDKESLNTFYRAVLKAVQYDASQYDGKAFHLLEGTVRKANNGKYVFTPNPHLASMLESCSYPALLKIEESRFLDLLTLALKEKD